MRVYGIDFTCAPSRKKPVTCAVCTIRDNGLVCDDILEWPSKKFTDFEDLLASNGPWIMGIDTPFGVARKFIKENEWPEKWSDYIQIIGAMSRREFRNFLDRYKAPRAVGDKEHKRVIDKRTGAMSPQNRRVNGMFYEVTTRILQSDANIPLLRKSNQCNKIIVETYPGHIARNIIGRPSYKDARVAEVINSQKQLRENILAGLKSIEVRTSFVDDATGDKLDALLCAVQAAWAWSMRDQNYGIPVWADPLEGWIVDETLYEAAT